MNARVTDLLELVRAPAALTVLGDTVAGATSARGSIRGSALPLAAASACLYAAGMALNDYADAELDASERPERPIPSGRVGRGTALRVGAGLTALGVGLAFTAGRGPGRVSIALAGAVWAYDLVAKPTRLGPIVMAACRGLDVMMGAAGPGWRRALVPAFLVAAHTGALTMLSRGEVHGTTPAVAGAAAAVSMGAAAGVVASASASTGALIGSAGYLAATLPAQLEAVRRPDAAHARTATRSAIRAMVPLQTALVARTGARAATAVMLGVELLGRVVTRMRTKGDVT